MKDTVIRVGQVWRSKTRVDLILEVLEIVEGEETLEYDDESIRLIVRECRNDDLLNHKTWFTPDGLTKYYECIEDVFKNPKWEV